MATLHLLKISRLESLTDGIFAIAMTIMVLNLHVPPDMKTLDVLPLIQRDLYNNLIIYFGSFFILGTHWIAMNFQWGLLDRVNRTYLWANMIYLMFVCIIPFSASLLGEYPHSRESVYFYAANLFGASLMQLFVLETAHYYGLFKSVYTNKFRYAAIRRVLVAPCFYVMAIIFTHYSVHGAFALLVAPTLIYIIPGQIDKFEQHQIP